MRQPEKILTPINILLFFFVGYLFYMLWDNQALQTLPIKEQEKKYSETLEDKVLTSKENNTLPVATSREQQTPREFEDEKNISLEPRVPMLTDKEISTEIEETYEALRPNHHDVILQKSQEVFEELDGEIEQFKQRIKEENKLFE